MALSTCHATIRVYLSAVRHLHLSRGLGDPLENTLRLDLVMKGVSRRRGSGADKRLPITPLVLKEVLRIVSRDPTNFDNIMMWAACCLGYFAFLRAGEFTVSEPFDPAVHLSVEDVAVDNHQNPTMISVHLKKSKTDQEMTGMTLYVGRTKQDICPVSAVLTYLVKRRGHSQNGPLFIREDGSPLSKVALVGWLRTTLTAAGMDASRFSGHSFRIGAASTAAARGIADSTIQSLGRWKSDSFKRYIRVPREDLAALSATIAS